MIKCLQSSFFQYVPSVYIVESGGGVAAGFAAGAGLGFTEGAGGCEGEGVTATRNVAGGADCEEVLEAGIEE